MNKLLLFTLSSTLAFSSINDINSFQAEFTQSVTDDKNTSINYKGKVFASKPQNALWNYYSPIEKTIYISSYDVTIVEPEIEQVIIKRIESSFDFFMMIKNAVKKDDNTYIAHYKDSKFTITTKDKLIYSISYMDEFDNSVKIIFKNQKQNIEIKEDLFVAKYPLDFDIIRD